MTNKQFSEWYSKLHNRLLFLLISFSIGIAIYLLLGKANNYYSEKQRIKRKLKYFNPVMKEGFWGNKITWVGRDKPLSDEEVEKLM